MSEENRENDTLADALASMRTVSDSAPPSRQSPRSRAVRSVALDRAIKTRQTLIPVLLTLGVMLPIVGSLKWLSSPESPFRSWETTPVLVLIAVGVVALLMAVANMVQVRQLLCQRPRQGV